MMNIIMTMTIVLFDDTTPGKECKKNTWEGVRVGLQGERIEDLHQSGKLDTPELSN